MFVPALIKAHADFKAGVTDFDAYKGEIQVVLDQISQQSESDKAKAFDEIFKSVGYSLTNSEEVYDGEPFKMWYDSDAVHYVWEDVMTSVFGPNFFDFYNEAYTGG